MVAVVSPSVVLDELSVPADSDTDVVAPVGAPVVEDAPSVSEDEPDPPGPDPPLPQPASTTTANAIYTNCLHPDTAVKVAQEPA